MDDSLAEMLGYPRDKLAGLSAQAVIKVESVDTEDNDRDTHLRSADFFDAESHPEIRFKSTKAEAGSGNKGKLHGELTIRGVTKPVILDFEFGGVANFMGKERAALTASGVINRKDFGVSWNRTLDTGGLVVGDDVRIELEIEGIEKGATE